jgi:hypothetical protein
MRNPLITAAAALALSAPARAEELNGVWFAGGTAGESVSAYAGGLVALPGYRLGEGLAVKAAINGGRYRYDSDGTEIRANYYGGSLALVGQFSGPWGWANVSAGPRVTNTDLSPSDPENRRAGTRWDLDFGTDGALDRGRWRLGWFGELGVRDQRYLVHLQAARRVGPGETRFGLEVGLQGDELYSQRSAGVLVSFSPGANINLQTSAGLTDQDGRAVQPYASAGLSQVF